MLHPLSFMDRHISYRRKLGSPLGCCLDQQGLKWTREKKLVSTSERWIQFFRGHLIMSAGPLPSAVHSWHDGSERKVVISRAAMIVFERTRPWRSAHAAWRLARFHPWHFPPLNQPVRCGPEQWLAVWWSRMGLHVVIYINNGTCLCLGNANTWCQGKGQVEAGGGAALRSHNVNMYSRIRGCSCAARLTCRVGRQINFRGREQHDLFGAGVLQRIAAGPLCKPQTRCGPNGGSGATLWHKLE